MATRDYSIATVGPFEYDDADAPRAFATSGSIQADEGFVGPTLQAWPIGSVFLSVVSTNPNTLLGFGTWAQIAQGQMLVGYKNADADFGTVEGTGGAKTHKHSIDPPNTASGVPSASTDLLGTGAAGAATGNHTHNVDIAAFDSETVSNLPPFFTIYAWKRTA